MKTVDWLLWLPLGMDVILAVVTYPMFLVKGLSWCLEMHEQEESATKKKDEIPSTEQLANDSRVQAIWEILMVAYSGYVALLFLAVYHSYQNAEAFAMTTSWSMFFLMLAKIACTKQMQSLNTKFTASGQSKQKEYSLYFFYLPTYGGYAILTTFFGW